MVITLTPALVSINIFRPVEVARVADLGHIQAAVVGLDLGHRQAVEHVRLQRRQLLGAELPPPQREVFEKTELHGYSIKMLAEETGASEQALLSRKHKAVLFLRTRLRDVYDALTGE